MIEISEHGGSFAGGRGGVKKIQHITAGWDHNGQLSKFVTIEKINRDNAYIIIHSPNGDVGNGYHAFHASLDIAGNGDSLVWFGRHYYGQISDPMHVTVVEMEKLKSKQIGTDVAEATGDMPITFSAVNPAKTIIIVSVSYEFAGSTYKKHHYGVIVSSTTATIINVLNGAQYYWQIIEFD
ncbi:hypothetical protein [Domibacillus aminovorans]|uniref:Uncharacterized protein n=1 Tax=Domibacillus aminovorans TaxID=29332 RepID=A0A177L982_9BACI|nr:hypothetical protein [Domibacillus aminovorans]OAH61946.1 hypothetical protein AWH49_11015 [Domibacillus aminovorans]